MTVNKAKETPMRSSCPSTAQQGRHLRVSILLGLMLLGAGSILSCESTGPSFVARLTTVEVTPAAADLCAPAPANTLQLTIVPRDQNGGQLPVNGGTATYSSSAPAVAGVSSSGLVSAAAPGTAVITAAFSVDGITKSGSMNATVHEGSGEYPEIAGVYDLTAVVTAWDQAFGMPSGSRETAVITIQPTSDSPLFGGAYADFRWFEPGAKTPSYGPVSGSLSGSVDCVGQVVIALRRAEGEGSFWDGRGTVGSGEIVGVFSEVGDVGTFTAVRRQAE